MSTHKARFSWLVPLSLWAVLLPGAALASPGSSLHGHPGGPLPAGLDSVYEQVRQDTYDFEILMSFGSSKGDSAGHIGVAFKGAAPDGDDLVYTANFYADRKPESEERGFYTENFFGKVPKREYLYGTRSSLSPKAVFGLDYGEVYRRSVIGIRVGGAPRDLVGQVRGFWDRLNADYRARAEDTIYQKGLVHYDYYGLNCAKSTALGFREGAGMRDILIKDRQTWARLNPVKQLSANIPMETAMNITEAAASRGWSIDTVLYRKSPSDHVPSYATDGKSFAEMPDRFPSVFSLDFLSGAAHYEDFDNLRNMHLLFDLSRYILRIDPVGNKLVIERQKQPEVFEVAEARATKEARKKRKHVLRRLLFRAWGLRFSPKVDNSDLPYFEPPALD